MSVASEKVARCDARPYWQDRLSRPAIQSLRPNLCPCRARSRSLARACRHWVPRRRRNQAPGRERACPNASAGADVGRIDAGRIASHITQDRGRDLRRIARSELSVVPGQPREIIIIRSLWPSQRVFDKCKDRDDCTTSRRLIAVILPSALCRIPHPRAGAPPSLPCSRTAPRPPDCRFRPTGHRCRKC